jgi:hypothetical protein
VTSRSRNSVAGSNAARNARIYIVQQFIVVFAAFVALEWQLYWVLPSSSYNYCLQLSVLEAASVFSLAYLEMAFAHVPLVSMVTVTVFIDYVFYKQGCLKLV